MKPYEIYNLWVTFDAMSNDPSFSTEQKIALGTDMLMALPPEMLCSSSKPSLTVVKEAMEGRLNDYTQSIRTTELPARSSSMARSEGTDPKADEGDGVSVEDLGNASKPKKKAGTKGLLSSEAKP